MADNALCGTYFSLISISFVDDSVYNTENKNNGFAPMLPTQASLNRPGDPVKSWGAWKRFVAFVS